MADRPPEQPQKDFTDESSRSEVSDAVLSLKLQGNTALTKGDLDVALERYSQALVALSSPSTCRSAQEEKELRVDILCNRALVYIKLGKSLLCVEDCNAALIVDPGRVKALYRRALSREALGEDAGALQDLRKVLELEPTNKTALVAARRVKDMVAKSAEENSPIRQALRTIAAAAAAVVAHQPDDGEQVTGQASTLSSTSSANVGGGGGTQEELKGTRTDLDHAESLKALGSLLSSNPSASVQLVREGGLLSLSSLCRASVIYPLGGREAYRALAQACQHRVFGTMLLKGCNANPDPKSDVDGLVLCLDAKELLEKKGVKASVGEAVVTMAVQLMQWDQAVVMAKMAPKIGNFDGSQKLERPQVEKEGGSLIQAALGVWSSGLGHAEIEVRDMAVEAVVRWSRLDQDDKGERMQPMKETDMKSLGNSSSRSKTFEERQANHRRRVWSSLFIRDKGLAFFKSPALIRLYKILSSESAHERRKASACLSRVARSVTEVQASESERKEDSACIQEVMSPLLVFQSRADEERYTGKEEDDEIGIVLSSQSRLEGSIRRVAAATALANAENGLGAWAMGRKGFLGEAMTLAATGDHMAQEVAAESFCSAASFEGGRALLGPVVESGIIFALMESAIMSTRSAAASAYAKLGMISSALSSDSDDITKLLNVSLDVIAPSKTRDGATTAKRTPTPTPNPNPASAAMSSKPDAKTKDINEGKIGRGGADGDRERAVEVLSFLVSKTKVKEELCYGSARCPRALERLCQAGQGVTGRSPIAYGLAFLFSSLCICKEDEMKESFRNKDTTYEQYQQLKQLSEAHGQGAKEDATDTPDSSAAAKRRSHALAEAGVVQTLKQIALDASPTTKERVALCFRRLATEPLNRGLIIQQGGLTLLINMCSLDKTGEGDTRKGSGDTSTKGGLDEARHAMAKTLVTLNPSLLTDSQTMGCVPPLIAMCRDHEATNLQQFEALMALTNLGSLDEVKGRIVEEKGITSFQYLQFSDHMLVRRASTEALCNLLPHIKMVEHLRQKETMKLWSAFCQLGEEDPPTAAAALGCVAMAIQDDQVANSFMEVGGCESLVFALESEAPEIPNSADLILRAAATCISLVEKPIHRSKLVSGGVPQALEAARKHTDGLGAVGASASSACEDALKIFRETLSQ